jgi:hypothetical protein
MSGPFFERLKEYYINIGKVLRGEAKAASIFPNTTDIGMSRERVYAEVLRLHLPSSCNVELGGFLFDHDGNESKQIDILITNESSLQFKFLNRGGSGKSFACIDGCIGIVSVKSKLDSTQLVDALHNFASIPNKQALVNRAIPFLNVNDYDEWPYKVIFASDGIEPSNILTSLITFYVSNPSIPLHKCPNLIHVSGKYVIVRTEKDGGVTRDGTSIAPNTFYAISDDTDVYGLFHTISRMQLIALSSKYILFVYNDLLDRIPF